LQFSVVEVCQYKVVIIVNYFRAKARMRVRSFLFPMPACDDCQRNRFSAVMCVNQTPVVIHSLGNITAALALRLAMKKYPRIITVFQWHFNYKISEMRACVNFRVSRVQNVAKLLIEKPMLTAHIDFIVKLRRRPFEQMIKKSVYQVFP